MKVLMVVLMVVGLLLMLLSAYFGFLSFIAYFLARIDIGLLEEDPMNAYYLYKTDPSYIERKINTLKLAPYVLSFWLVLFITGLILFIVSLVSLSKPSKKKTPIQN
ncbi:MAG: hypothetical protein QXT10_04010 [Candidatus Bathyarchaeia archaeon]